MTLSDPWYWHLRMYPRHYPLWERGRAREALPSIPWPSSVPSDLLSFRKPHMSEPELPRITVVGSLGNRGDPTPSSRSELEKELPIGGSFRCYECPSKSGDPCAVMRQSARCSG